MVVIVSSIPKESSLRYLLSEGGGFCLRALFPSNFIQFTLHKSSNFLPREAEVRVLCYRRPPVTALQAKFLTVLTLGLRKASADFAALPFALNLQIV